MMKNKSFIVETKEKAIETVMNTVINYGEIKSEITDLREIIVVLDTAFHETGDDCINPITGDTVTDNEYDALKKRLEQLDPKWSGFKTVTAAKDRNVKGKIIHDPPMTSISKCNGTQVEKEEILEKFFKDCYKIDTDYSAVNKKSWPGWLGHFFTMSYKHDGLALSCEFEKGELKRVGLRSKSGMDGINVTDKAKYIAGIPQTLKSPITCTIRGEVETSISDFKRVSAELGEDAKKNPRAHTSGSMNQKTAEKMKDRGLRFTAYNVVNIKDPPYKTEIERAKWTSKQGFHFVKTFPFTYDMLKTFEENHRKLDFMVDGVVISISNLELQKQMGTSGNKKTGNPKGKIAFKFSDEIKKAKVKEVVWQTGRTGNITPVLIFDGIDLEGTTVSKCTAHNWGYMKSKKIGVGAIVEIIKSGKIIPKVKSVISPVLSAIAPLNCPSCNGSIEEVNGNNGTLSLVCNNTQCPAQNVKNLNHFLTVLGVKGIAEKNIEKFIESKLVEEPGDFYILNIQKLLAAGFTKRTAILILARLFMVPEPEQIKDDEKLLKIVMDVHPTHKKLKIPMEKFFAALGIKNAGKEVGRILTKEIGNWKEIETLTVEELEAFDGIGPISAKEVVSFFNKNKVMIDTVLCYLELEVPQLGGDLEGKTFVLSGSLEGGKAKWKTAIEAKGGTVKGSVGRKIDFLVAGDGSGSKSAKAKELGICILTVKELEKLV